MSEVTMMEELQGIANCCECEATEKRLNCWIKKASAAPEQESAPFWIDGAPDRVYGSEWFMAELMNGDRVVLVALGEDNSYDYKTADLTFFTKSFVRRWAQFPDSDYVPARLYTHADDGEVERLRAELEAEAKGADRAAEAMLHWKKETDSIREQLAEAQALLQRGVLVGRPELSVVRAALKRDAEERGMPVRAEILADLDSSIERFDTLLSATAQPAEVKS